MIVYLMYNFNIRVLCARAFQNKIEESVYSLLKDKAYLLGVGKDFKFFKSSIVCNRTGAKAVFYGLNRNIDEIKSLENISICWVEEAQFITEEQFNILVPTIRGGNSEIWLSFNPKNKNDYVYKRFVLGYDSSSIVKKINYTENPFAPQVLIDEANSLRELDETLYSHVYLGELLDDNSNRFFKNVILSPHRLNEFGRIYIGFDVSDGGNDPHAIIVESNGVLVECMEILGEYERGIKVLINTIKKYLPMRKEIFVIYDAIGVGAGVGHSLKDFKQIKIIPFKASNAVIKANKKEILPYPNKEAYYNLKAQIWHIMGFYTKEIKYQNMKLVNNLKDQLEAPYITYQSNKILVEKKKDLLKRGISSPNLADAYICILYAKYVKNVLTI